MTNTLSTTATICIDAPVSKVWQAITDPAIIKQYLFGTEVITDWQKGSKITYKGEFNGKPYVDKGKIIDIVPEKFLYTTYLSGNSGKEDIPENYNNVVYKLEKTNEGTVVSITQDNIADEKEQEHMHDNWSKVLEGMKKVMEN